MTNRTLKHLEEYLREEMAAGKIDFHIRARIDERTRVRFYIRPLGKSGDTQDYFLENNVLFVDTIDEPWPDTAGAPR